MVPPSRPTQERRRHLRLTPSRARVWCVSGEFEEVYTAINFARRIVNLGLGGICIESTGRLRPGVTMSVEVRFDDLGGALRSEARVVWVDTSGEGAVEVHRAGLRFHGTLDVTQPVREYLEGGRATSIISKRQVEYEDLKRKSVARQEEAAPRKRGGLKKFLVVVSLLVALYAGSFWGFVLSGRDAAKPGIAFRYLGSRPRGDGAEALLAKAYGPLVLLFQKAGVDLRYDPP